MSKNQKSILAGNPEKSRVGHAWLDSDAIIVKQGLRRQMLYNQYNTRGKGARDGRGGRGNGEVDAPQSIQYSKEGGEIEGDSRGDGEVDLI